MFEKRNIHFAGLSIPGIVIGQPQTVMVELASGKRIPSQFADVLSLRETNPDGPNAGQSYLTVTNENLRFTTLRFDNVPGLDYDPETGALLSIEDLEKQRAADITARQQATMAARQTAEVDLDA